MPEKKDNGTAEKQNESKANHDLYIGVNNDLSPFKVDLNALTRGLVVVGQSGCGKSFMLGRFVEELLRNTTDRTRLLIVDANSDFSEGTKLKKRSDFERLVVTYCPGSTEGPFEDFFEREDEIYSELSSDQGLPKAQLFGRSEDFNLSWSWLVADHTRFLKIVKADTFSVGYPWAFRCAEHSMAGEMKNLPEEWMKLALAVLERKKQDEDSPTPTFYLAKPLKIESVVEDEAFLQLMTDLWEESTAGVWRDQEEDDGLPERLFTESRVNILEVETIPERASRLKTVAFVLLHCLTQHKGTIEKYRACRAKDDKSAIAKTAKNLHHTFILIDEAHNYAPDGTNDPHEKMLGELIHGIAAEGRKYGLHVILATQRPNKIKRGLLGECDNAIIMKMNSRSDLEHLSKEMRILDVKLLEPCVHFHGQGNAIAVGEMTRMAPYVQLFRSAPRRTREGGVDIAGF